MSPLQFLVHIILVRGFFLYDFIDMKNLIISGKANITIPAEGLKKQGSELWLCGTDTREGADCYFELHGLGVPHQNVIRELPEEVYNQGLPVNNTICAMAVYAYLKGYKNIQIIGAPMDAKDEYLKQRPALAYVCGYLNAKGMNVIWDVIPETINYGKKKVVENGEEYKDSEESI